MAAIRVLLADAECSTDRAAAALAALVCPVTGLVGGRLDPDVAGAAGAMSLTGEAAADVVGHAASAGIVANVAGSLVGDEYVVRMWSSACALAGARLPAAAGERRGDEAQAFADACDRAGFPKHAAPLLIQHLERLGAGPAAAVTPGTDGGGIGRTGRPYLAARFPDARGNAHAASAAGDDEHSRRSCTGGGGDGGRGGKRGRRLAAAAAAAAAAPPEWWSRGAGPLGASSSEALGTVASAALAAPAALASSGAFSAAEGLWREAASAAAAAAAPSSHVARGAAPAGGRGGGAVPANGSPVPPALSSRSSAGGRQSLADALLSDASDATLLALAERGAAPTGALPPTVTPAPRLASAAAEALSTELALRGVVGAAAVSRLARAGASVAAAGGVPLADGSAAPEDAVSSLAEALAGLRRGPRSDDAQAPAAAAGPAPPTSAERSSRLAESLRRGARSEQVALHVDVPALLFVAVGPPWLVAPPSTAGQAGSLLAAAAAASAGGTGSARGEGGSGLIWAAGWGSAPTGGFASACSKEPARRAEPGVAAASAGSDGRRRVLVVVTGGEADGAGADAKDDQEDDDGDGTAAASVTRWASGRADPGADDVDLDDDVAVLCRDDVAALGRALLCRAAESGRRCGALLALLAERERWSEPGVSVPEGGGASAAGGDTPSSAAASAPAMPHPRKGRKGRRRKQSPPRATREDRQAESDARSAAAGSAARLFACPGAREVEAVIRAASARGAPGRAASSSIPDRVVSSLAASIVPAAAAAYAAERRAALGAARAELSAAGSVGGVGASAEATVKAAAETAWSRPRAVQRALAAELRGEAAEAQSLVAAALRGLPLGAEAGEEGEEGALASAGKDDGEEEAEEAGAASRTGEEEEEEEEKGAAVAVWRRLAPSGPGLGPAAAKWLCSQVPGVLRAVVGRLASSAALLAGSRAGLGLPPTGGKAADAVWGGVERETALGVLAAVALLGAGRGSAGRVMSVECVEEVRDAVWLLREGRAAPSAGAAEAAGPLADVAAELASLVDRGGALHPGGLGGGAAGLAAALRRTGSALGRLADRLGPAEPDEAGDPGAGSVGPGPAEPLGRALLAAGLGRWPVPGAACSGDGGAGPSGGGAASELRRAVSRAVPGVVAVPPSRPAPGGTGAWAAALACSSGRAGDGRGRAGAGAAVAVRSLAERFAGPAGGALPDAAEAEDDPAELSLRLRAQGAGAAAVGEHAQEAGSEDEEDDDDDDSTSGTEESSDGDERAPEGRARAAGTFAMLGAAASDSDSDE